MSSPLCYDPDHFEVVDGVLSPQPWMQHRPVTSDTAKAQSGWFGVTGGGNKNVLLHSVQRSWENASPVPQWCYGLITRGGCRVTLQARSRGYLALSSSFVGGLVAGALTDISWVGCGGDIGRAGILALGTGFCIHELRQNSRTIPLLPDTAGWMLLEPGQGCTAKVQLRFITEQYESTIIDGGNQESESSYDTGDTRLDLFAVPALDCGIIGS